MNRKTLAVWSLYLAVAAALVAFGLYVVQRAWNLPLQISLALAIAGLALFIVLDPDRVRALLTGREARYGSNALLMGLAVLGILIVINYLVYRNPQRWDLTEDRLHSLAPETIDTLEALPGTVTIRAFFTERNPANQTQIERARDLLEDYQYYSDGQVEYRFINPDTDPIAAQEANVTRDGTLVLSLDGVQEQVTILSEQEITAALVRLLNPEQIAIYFLTGHGERDLEAVADEGFARAKSLLETKNYTVVPLNLFATNQIPADAGAIVIAGPTQPISEAEIEMLDAFLAGGGAMLVLVEPSTFTEVASDDDPLGAYLQESWGIALGDDLVVDLSSNQPLVAVANQYGNHRITQRLQGLVTFFPTARSVQLESTEGDTTLASLVMTADQSWAETDLVALENDQEISPTEGEDLLGPVTLAAVGERFENESRIAVFGDSDFASNGYFDSYGNSDLFVNALDWAVQQEDLIDLTPRQQTSRVLLPPQQYVLGLILLGSLFLLPGLVLVSGAVVWFRRRQLG